ncbi:hypothetical protein DMENIID0001_164520 [Sergentomyia squamirostris]
MKWYLVNILLVVSVFVICMCEEIPIDKDESPVDHGTEHDEDEKFPSDEAQQKHHSHHSHHYQKPIYPVYVPKPPKITVPTATTEKGPIPLPNPKPKSCPRYEEYHDCGSPCQVECSNLGTECSKKNIRCTDGCYCIPGYARKSSNGPCIPQFQCPHPYCSANEVWLDCYQAPACDTECTRLGKPCDSIGGKCNAGCFCRLGYARHPKTNDCVPTNKCPPKEPKEPKCSTNEEFQSCDFRCTEDCDENRCLVEKRPCEKGCFCKAGYARIDGVCKPRDKCPVTCPAHEIYLECGSSCRDDCKKDKYCNSKCIKGCFCENGYARVDGVCIPRSKCPSSCPAHEVFLECGTACQDDCLQNKLCINKCIKGCFCEPGYARIDGVCIPRAKCPNNCPANEEFLDCGSACQDNCDQSQPCTDQCLRGCFCKSGYARIDGVCVPRNKCPAECPKNEHYDSCGNTCTDSCNSDRLFCPAICKPGCYCDEGYARIHEKCVPRTKCPPVCPENEYYNECGNNCIDSCDRDRLDCPPNCYSGCYCNKGYARIDGKCVPRDQCNKCTSLTEEYLTCGNGCQDLCNTSNVRCSDKCIEGCFCLPGYSRIDGMCVPRSECFNCASGEQYTDCGNPCLEQCNRNAILCPDVCEEGCFCASGYSRIKGKCLPNELCPNCGENEEYQSCGNKCMEQCGADLCPADIPCKKGCYCKSGFRRLGKECISENECPSLCTDPNSEYRTCGNQCEDRCTFSTWPCDADKVCVSGCYCKAGYKRLASTGLCVPDINCPLECAAPNELYAACGNNCTDLCPDPVRVCDLKCYPGCFCQSGFYRNDYNSPCLPSSECTCIGDNSKWYTCANSCTGQCADPKVQCDFGCRQGCNCKDGFVRLTRNGQCVPEWKCPVPCNRPFEEINDCGNTCTELCPRPGRKCNKNCWKGCFCKKGYFREQPGGICIPQAACPAPPVCTGPNEEIRDCGKPCYDDCPGIIYECPDDCKVGCYCKPGFKRLTRGGPCVPDKKCPNVCTKANEEFTDCGSPCREQCPSNDSVCPDDCYLGCYCKAGYSRINGECVPTSKCPPTCSDPNEEFTTCGNACSEKCKKGLCPQSCRVGCFCKAGYSRQDGVCIPNEQCPGKCQDPNEEFTTCGNECYEKCSSGICPQSCRVGCFCKSGYSRQDGVCIPTEQCPGKCQDPYEEYSDCGNSCKESCSSARKLCPLFCKRGCYCKSGYSRQDGVCIPSEQCPGKCEDPNEEYTSCGNPCFEKCSSGICPQSCRVGCFCKSGYSRQDGVCIPTEQCPGKCQDPYEEYSDCGNSCKESCSSARKLCPLFCKRGCYCKSGYSRQDGVCIPSEQCPGKCEDPNEEYTSCGNPCFEKCGSKICPEYCRVGCFCKSGYSRQDGVCIPTDQCPGKCQDPNEEYKECGNSCKESCSSARNPCPLFCKPGCYCKSGYSRQDGACIPTDQCPGKCQDPNEEYSECGNSCKESCSSSRSPCPLFCKPGCYCKSGYSRSNGVCVPTDQCPGKCSGPNEVYSDCGNSCKEKCGTKFCPQVCETGCFCRPGYARVNGICIPKKKCPTCGENEQYTYCGSACTDPCETRGQTCLDACKEGCFCKDGYSRITPDTPCVPDSQCTSVACGKNEVWSDCGRDCQTQCDNMGVKCPIVHITCPSACYCEPGYARIFEGGCCVEQSVCPSSPCGDNEIWLECGDPPQPIPCPQNCDDIGTSCVEQYPTCDAPIPGGCYCKPGFSRAPNSSRCIPIDTCPPKRKVSKPKRPGFL